MSTPKSVITHLGHLGFNFKSKSYKGIYAVLDGGFLATGKRAKGSVTAQYDTAVPVGGKVVSVSGLSFGVIAVEGLHEALSDGDDKLAARLISIYCRKDLLR